MTERRKPVQGQQPQRPQEGYYQWVSTAPQEPQPPRRYGQGAPGNGAPVQYDAQPDFGYPRTQVVEAPRSERRRGISAGVAALTIFGVLMTGAAAYEFGVNQNKNSDNSSTTILVIPSEGAAKQDPTKDQAPVVAGVEKMAVHNTTEAANTFGDKSDAYTNNPENWSTGQYGEWKLKEDGNPHMIQHLAGYYAEGWVKTVAPYGNYNKDGQWGTTDALTIVVDGNGIIGNKAVFNGVTIWTDGTTPEDVRAKAQNNYANQVVPNEAIVQPFVKVIPGGLQDKDCLNQAPAKISVNNAADAAQKFGDKNDAYTSNAGNWSQGQYGEWHLKEDGKPHLIKNLGGYYGEGWVKTVTPYGNYNKDGQWGTTDALTFTINGNGVIGNSGIFNGITIYTDGTNPVDVEAKAVHNYKDQVVPNEAIVQPFVVVIPAGQSVKPC